MLRRVFLNRNYGLILAAYGLSLLGTNMSFLAIIALLYSRTGRALDVGVYTIVNIVAGVLSGPVAGAVADRLPRRRLMIVANLINGVLIGLLIFANQSLYVYAVGFLMTFVNRFFVASRMSMLPDLVQPAELVTANAHMTFASLLARIIGPAVAGLLVAALGPLPVFALDALSYILGAVLIALAPVREPRRQAAAAGGVAKEMMQGISFLFVHRVLRYMVILGIVDRVFLSMLTPLLIGFVFARLAGGTKEYGLILSAASVGGVLGSYLAKRFEAWRVNRLNLAAWGIALSGAVMLCFLLSRSVPLAAALYAGYHVVLFASIINIHASVQELTPDNMRGKVFGSIGSVFGPSHLLSMLVGAALADRFGVYPVLAFSALGFLVVSTVLVAATSGSRRDLARASEVQAAPGGPA
jgi:predicted MFS family arabinose efflux permease